MKFWRFAFINPSQWSVENFVSSLNRDLDTYFDRGADDCAGGLNHKVNLDFELDLICLLGARRVPFVMLVTVAVVMLSVVIVNHLLYSMQLSNHWRGLEH